MGNMGIIILAAGSSSRFNGVKQLSMHHDRTFIRHALSEAANAEKNTIVVLGANVEEVKREIADLDAQAVFNSHWEEGISSSIRCGLNALLKGDPDAEAAIFMVCDQPFVSSSLLKELMATYAATNKQIVASAYGNTFGTPVLFEKTFFPALLSLKGQSGAKKVISENMGSTVTVAFPMGTIDIDTKNDYEALQKNQINH
jgi:molybdenum cofactor cytidylyltransferase